MTPASRTRRESPVAGLRFDGRHEYRARRLANLRLGLLVGVATAVALGCAGSASGPRANATDVPATHAAGAVEGPSWLTRGCRAFWTDAAERRAVVCGVGSAPAHRDRVRARDTAVARARSEIARSLEVTIESLVRLEDGGSADGDLDTIVHQLSSTSMRGVQVEEIWRSDTGAVHALVSLDLDRVQKSVRSAPSLAPAEREALAQRAADAFAELDAAFAEAESAGSAR